jgi:hypothetical protein
MPVQLTSREISHRYNDFARWYDLVEGAPDLFGVRKLRRRLLKPAAGKVLEVAVGTGSRIRWVLFRRWPGFVDQRVESFFWSMERAIAYGSGVGRIAGQSATRSSSAVTGTGNR